MVMHWLISSLYIYGIIQNVSQTAIEESRFIKDHEDLLELVTAFSKSLKMSQFFWLGLSKEIKMTVRHFTFMCHALQRETKKMACDTQKNKTQCQTFLCLPSPGSTTSPVNLVILWTLWYITYLVPEFCLWLPVSHHLCTSCRTWKTASYDCNGVQHVVWHISLPKHSRTMITWSDIVTIWKDILSCTFCVVWPWLSRDVPGKLAWQSNSTTILFYFIYSFKLANLQGIF